MFLYHLYDYFVWLHTIFVVSNVYVLLLVDKLSIYIYP